MSAKEETVSKSQMYFQGLLPGNIYRTRTRSFARILGTGNNEDEAREIDKNQLVDVTLKVLREWGQLANARVDQTLLMALENPMRFIEVISPESLYIEPYPMMLQCNLCGRLDQYRNRVSNEDRVRQVARTIRRAGNKTHINCPQPDCHGHMKQIRHIAVHRCGKIESITLPYNTYDIQHLGYKDRGGTFAQSRFINLDTGQQIGQALQSDCRDCHQEFPQAHGNHMRGTTVDNPEKFYPHNIQYLCLKKETGEQVSKLTGIIGNADHRMNDAARDIAEAVASCLIGLTTGDVLAQHIREIIGGNGPDRGKMDTIIQKLDESRRHRQDVINSFPPSISKEIVEKTTSLFDKEIRDLEDQLNVASGRFANVRQLINNDTVLHALASNRRSLEATLMPYDFSRERQALPEMIRLVDDPIRRDRLTQDASVLLEQYGVMEIAHYKEINVVMASIGYTREKPTPGENVHGDVVPTVLMGYEDLVSDRLKGKHVIYGLPARTEALHIRFDPCSILRWWVEGANQEFPGEDILNDRTLAKAYLLAHCPALTMEPSEVIAGTRERPVLESSPFHLLHTISHCLLGTIKRHTGYDEKSVMEYIFPMDLSIILYVTSVQNYTAGGLLTLFKHYLREWFDDASNYAFNCIFDPICSDKGSTCSGCVQIVLGCETFNHGLSRSYLHGGKIDSEQQIMIQRGFWN